MTSETPTPEVLDELERLEKSATPGPWEAHKLRRLTHVRATNGGGCLLSGASVYRDAEAELVTATRNHLPALIAAARELRETKRALYRVTALGFRRVADPEYVGWRILASWHDMPTIKAHASRLAAHFERMAADCDGESGR